MILNGRDADKCVEAIAKLDYWFHNPFPLFNHFQLGEDLATLVFVFDFHQQDDPEGARFQYLQPLMDGRTQKTHPKMRILKVPSWDAEQRAAVTTWILGSHMASFFDARSSASNKFPLKGACQHGAYKQLLLMAPAAIQDVHDRVIAQIQAPPVHIQAHLTLLSDDGALSHYPHADPFSKTNRRAVVTLELPTKKAVTAKFRQQVLDCRGQVLIPVCDAAIDTCIMRCLCDAAVDSYIMRA